MCFTEGKDDIGSVNSQKFNKIMKEIESSHNEGTLFFLVIYIYIYINELFNLILADKI